MKSFLSRIFSVVFLIFLFSNAFAMVDSGSNDCTLIGLESGMLSLGKSSEKELQVSLHNSAGEPFYLEKINIVDDVSGMMASATLSDKTILPFESKGFSVTVETLEGVAFGKHSLFLEAKGHFFNGDSCNYNDLRIELPVEVVEEKQEFVKKETEKVSGNEFVLNAPEQVVIAKDEEISSVLLSIENGLDERVEVMISGANISLYNNYLSIPANTKIEKMIYFSAKEDKTYLQVDAKSDSFEFESSVIEIVKDTLEEEELEGEEEPLPAIGFLNLTQAGLLLGFVLLVIAIAALTYMGLEQRQKTKARVKARTKKAKVKKSKPVKKLTKKK